MELGVLYDLRNPPSSGISNAEVYAETLAHIEAMEGLGFDVVWLTEHHFIDDSYLPATLTMAAAVAARTERVTIGTAVLLLPLHDPLHVAEEAAVVDLLSGGRLRLGLGLGYKLQEFEVFGVDRRHRRGLMEEGVEVIRRSWADGPFTFEGRHHRYHDLDVTPKPAQRPGPEIWLAGRDPVPAERAARLGDGLIATPGPDTFALVPRGTDAARSHRIQQPVHLRLHLPDRRPRACGGRARLVRRLPHGALRPVVRGGRRPGRRRGSAPDGRRREPGTGRELLRDA